MARNISQLQKLEMMRKDVVANISHALRTTVTVITGYRATMMDGRNNLPPRWIRPIEQMAQQSHHVESIIRDLLTLSQLAQLETRATSKDQSSIQLSSLLREIKNDAGRMLSEKQHHIAIQRAENSQIKGNSNELYSAVFNLALNAAKYTPA